MTARLCFLLPLVLLTGCSGQPGIRPLTILHTSDLHARFLPDDEGLGGFAQLTTAIRKEKESSQNAIVLHAGDFVQGTPVSSIFEGIPVFEVANRMGFDATTIGNHEFDYGWHKTLDFVEAARFPTVSANVVNERGETIADPYVILEAGGMKIGVIGALTHRLPEITDEKKMGPWRALPVAETVERYAQELRGRTDLVLVLGHLFNEEDDEVLAQAPDVPVLISGHYHGGQSKVKDVNGRICVKTRSYGRELGRLDLQVDVKNHRVATYEWRLIQIAGDAYPPDAEVATLVDQWEAKVADIVDVKVGRSKRRITSKSELEPMLEEVMKEAVGADLAYMNPGGIRDGLPQGEILARHVWNMLPFGNTIRYGRVKGIHLPAELKDTPGIDPAEDYIVATNSFVAGKWASRGVVLNEEGPVLRTAMIEWIRKKKVVK